MEHLKNGGTRTLKNSHYHKSNETAYKIWQNQFFQTSEINQRFSTIWGAVF